MLLNAILMTQKYIFTATNATDLNFHDLLSSISFLIKFGILDIHEVKWTQGETFKQKEKNIKLTVSAKTYTLMHFGEYLSLLLFLFSLIKGVNKSKRLKNAMITNKI